MKKTSIPPTAFLNVKFRVENLIIPVTTGLLLFTTVSHLYSQGGGGGNGNAQTPWQTKGNSNVSSSDYIGTKFSDDLFIKTNSTERIRITGNGDIIFPSFAGSSDGLLTYDSTGKVKPVNPHKPPIVHEVFTGNMKFEQISSLSGWDYNGGTKNSSLADYTGFGGNTNPSEAVDVTGNMRASGTVTAPEGFLFDSSYGLKFREGTGVEPPLFQMGLISGIRMPPTPCTTISSPVFSMNGGLQTVAANGTYSSALSLYSVSWGGHGLIEVEGTDDQGNATNALWINYFCGRNTLINTNTGLANRGGNIIMGERVMMYKSLQIGWTADPIDEMTALNIFVNPENNISRKGIKFNTWDGNAKLISVNNPSNFTVYGDGRMAIGTISPDAKFQLGSDTKGLRLRDDGSAADIQSVGVPLYINSTGNNIYLAPNGGTVSVGTENIPAGYLFAVKGKIIAEDLNLKLYSDGWPDYVYKPGYERPTWMERKNYHEKNSRMFYMESAPDVKEKGITIGRNLIGLTRNMEEAWQEIIVLHEEKEMLKEEIMLLKKKIEKLERNQ